MAVLVQPALLSRDLDEIVDIHMESFPGFFLTLMGRGFVKEYYRCVLEYPLKLCFVAREEGRLVGFVIGFAMPQEFYNFYRARRFRLIPWLIIGAIRRPLIIPRILQNIRRVYTVKSEDGAVELSSISVPPEHSGKGIARKLISNFVQEANLRNYQSIYLTTDAENNERVNSFYRKQGFQVEQTVFQGQRKMNLLRLCLSSETNES